ncbi:hypothetical protein ACXR0O_04660 [Verrucomicrobiota bacterium sgz303538]
MNTSRWLPFLVVSALTLCSPFAWADTPGSLAAYFEGDRLREALLKLTPANETSVRRLDRTLTETSRFVKAEVITIHANGALVSLKSYSSAELSKDSPMPLEQPFFIYGVHEVLAGGAFWEGRVYPAGRFQYTAADKTEQTVNALAVSKEWALRAMENAATAGNR